MIPWEFIVLAWIGGTWWGVFLVYAVHRVGQELKERNRDVNYE